VYILLFNSYIEFHAKLCVDCRHIKKSQKGVSKKSQGGTFYVQPVYSEHSYSQSCVRGSSLRYCRSQRASTSTPRGTTVSFHVPTCY